MKPTTTQANDELVQQNRSIGDLLDNFVLQVEMDRPDMHVSKEAKKFAELVMMNELIFGSAYDDEE